MQARSHSLADALRAAPGVGDLLDGLERSRRIAHAVAELTRPAGFDASAPGACNWRADTVTLNVPTASQAAKLRQLVPRLEARLHASGDEGIQIRVRVQPDMTSYLIEGQSANTSPSAPSGALAGPCRGAPSGEAAKFADKLAHTAQAPALRVAALRLQRLLRDR